MGSQETLVTELSLGKLGSLVHINQASLFLKSGSLAHVSPGLEGGEIWFNGPPELWFKGQAILAHCFTCTMVRGWASLVHGSCELWVDTAL